MSNVKNVVLCGVGGQGTILASKILSYALIEAGYDVKMSEIHGMSQRGGSVTTQVRYGDKVYSAIIGKGSADVLVAFEKMEALRYLDDVKVEGGVVIINDHAIQSLPTLQGMASYPEDCIDRVKEKASDVRVIKATKIAGELGNEKAANVVLLGATVKALGLEDLNWDAALDRLRQARLPRDEPQGLQGRSRGRLRKAVNISKARRTMRRAFLRSKARKC